MQGTDPMPAVMARAAFQEKNKVGLRAAVLTVEESKRRFGVPLARYGIQAVWTEIVNGSNGPLYYLAVSTDRNYFSASEVAYRAHRLFSPSRNRTIDRAFQTQALATFIPAGATRSGFVFTHADAGLKFLTFGLASPTGPLKFRFVIPVAGPTYAVQKVRFDHLYEASGRTNVTLEGLRHQLEALPATVTNKAQNRRGDPLNLVIVGDYDDSIFPFIERGWRLDEPLDLHSILNTMRSVVFGTEYLTSPLSPLYVFDRQQDVSFQKARNSISQRNHLRLWLSPIMMEGRPVWIGQISRDIGVKLTTTSWYLTTHKISPSVDEDREYLLQDLMLSGFISHYGFVAGAQVSTDDAPCVNLGHDPYFSDGLRLVILLDANRRAGDPIRFLDWEVPAYLSTIRDAEQIDAA
jgi:hypothetical protein